MVKSRFLNFFLGTLSVLGAFFLFGCSNIDGKTTVSMKIPVSRIGGTARDVASTSTYTATVSLYAFVPENQYNQGHFEPILLDSKTLTGTKNQIANATFSFEIEIGSTVYFTYEIYEETRERGKSIICKGRSEPKTISRSSPKITIDMDENHAFIAKDGEEKNQEFRDLQDAINTIINDSMTYPSSNDSYTIYVYGTAKPIFDQGTGTPIPMTADFSNLDRSLKINIIGIGDNATLDGTLEIGEDKRYCEAVIVTNDYLELTLKNLTIKGGEVEYVTVYNAEKTFGGRSILLCGGTLNIDGEIKVSKKISSDSTGLHSSDGKTTTINAVSDESKITSLDSGTEKLLEISSGTVNVNTSNSSTPPHLILDANDDENSAISINGATATFKNCVIKSGIQFVSKTQEKFLTLIDTQVLGKLHIDGTEKRAKLNLGGTVYKKENNNVKESLEIVFKHPYNGYSGSVNDNNCYTVIYLISSESIPTGFTASDAFNADSRISLRITNYVIADQYAAYYIDMKRNDSTTESLGTKVNSFTYLYSEADKSELTVDESGVVTKKN